MARPTHDLAWWLKSLGLWLVLGLIYLACTWQEGV